MALTKVVFWDVQHGHATYVRSPNGRHVVVDLGIGSYSGSSTFSPLLHLRDQEGVDRLDYVVITHPHLDHIDDILNFDALNPRALQRPKHLTGEEILEGVREQDMQKFFKYLAIDDRYNSPVAGANDPKNPDNYGGLVIRTFVPRNCGRSNLNNHSVVAVFEDSGLRVVVPGDNEPCSLTELMEDPQFVAAVKDSDVLLAPHHGRESGYYSDFVNLVNPRLAVVSDGRAQGTDASSKYSKASRGWKVHHRKGGSSNRSCLTTRSDGDIVVNFGRGESGTVLQVVID